MNNKVSLTIFDVYARDVGRGIARVDSKTMDAIRATDDDIVELVGHKKTVAKVLKLYQSDAGKNMIRIDGITRNNFGKNIGDNITIRKIDSKRAEQVTMAALESIPPIGEKYLINALDSIPLIKVENTFVYPENTHDHIKLEILKESVAKYEKELLKKQEEIKTITRNMLKENHTIESINEFLNSGINEELLFIHQKLLNAYRQYVLRLESG